MKIQIASLAALERLIGGDSEIEIEIRQSVVENFSKKHLKALANSDLMSKISKSITEELQNTFFDKKKSTQAFGGFIFTLNEEAKNKLNTEINDVFTNKLRETVNELIGSTDMREKVTEMLEKQAKYIASELTSKNLSMRLDQMVDKKIKEKLGIKS